MAKKRDLKKWLGMAVVLAGMWAGVATGQVIYVDDDANLGGNGQTWGTGYKYLQDALTDAAVSGNDIWVAAGIYKPDDDDAHDPNGSGSRSATFRLKSGVGIYGGFAGGETSVDQRDWQTNVTVLSGDLDGNDVDVNDPCDLGSEPTRAENSYHVITGSGTNATAILDGFTIKGGNANGSYPANCGGGMYSNSGSPTLTNCTFSGNSALTVGGGMYNEDSSPTLTNCTFNGNYVDECGGAVQNEHYSSPTVTNCIFSGNSAGICAGGMRNYRSSPTLVNCTFIGNSAGIGPGGMDNADHSSPTLTNCIFSGNSAIAYDGGGIGNIEYSSPTLTNCIFSGNSAGSSGGGLYNCLSSSTTAINCTFTGNSAGDWGGAMDSIESSSTVLINCTFSGNSSLSVGGGMRNQDSNSIVTNCILWDNTAPSDPHIYNQGTSSVTVTYSDIGPRLNIYPGTGNINVDPLFVDADGPDDIVGTEDDNLRFCAGSPCIDAGDNTAVPGGVTTDLDGSPRFVDDPCTVDTGNPPGADAIVDMGAYECHSPIKCHPAIIFVDADAAGANDGSSWADAFNYLRDALSVASTRDEIWVAEGIYRPDQSSAEPNGTGARTATFQLINGVALRGGYAGYGEPDPNARDIEFYETILSGDLDGNDVPDLDPCDLPYHASRGENSYHVVTGSGTVGTAVLDGFMITGGNANAGALPNDSGGGMFNVNGSPTVSNCKFIENCSGLNGDGGGMYNDHSSPAVIDCIFAGNYTRRGGGMHNDNDSNATLTDCVFSDNWADDRGGGMFNSESDPAVSGCTFRANSASSGGAMSSRSCNSVVTNSTFTGNSAGQGGAMFNKKWTSAMVVNCTFTANLAGHGGGISNNDTSMTMTNCILSGNSSDRSDGEGGAIRNYNYEQHGSPLTVTNCTFADNSAPYGNGVYCDSNENTCPSNVEMTNCIFWDGGNEIYNDDNSVIAITYSDVQGGWGGPPNIDVDPCFVAPGYWDPNGTPQDANDDFWVDGSYYLRPTSACIDAGDPNHVANPNDTDLAGNPRIIDGDSDGNSVIDMGAYEYAYDVDGDDVSDANDNCLFTPNPGQSDIDEDGAGDLCDICPADANDECDPNGSAAEEIDPNEGGTIETPDGDLVIEIDPNDVNEPVTISVTQILPEDPNADLMIGPNPGWGQAVAVYDLQPDGMVFNEPVTLTITADVNELNENEQNRLGVYLWDDILEKFVLVESADCNVVEDPPGTFTKTCTVELEHFSIYAVVLPMEWDTLANGDLTGEGAIDTLDLLIMARNWLQVESIADIAPAPAGDNMVNFGDFGIMALHWLEGTGN